LRGDCIASHAPETLSVNKFVRPIPRLAAATWLRLSGFFGPRLAATVTLPPIGAQSPANGPPMREAISPVCVGL